jgi:AcrR family transcriptional regulator
MTHKPNAKTGLNPRKRASQERSTATVDAILEAAIRILGSGKHAALTTTAVAELAGVSVGTLYQYFPNKLAIVAELFRRHVAEVVNAITDTQLGEAKDFNSAVALIMNSMIAAERRQLAASLALKCLVQDVQGREFASAAARNVAQSMATLLQPWLGRAWTDDDMARLHLAIATVNGAVWEIIEHTPNMLTTDSLCARLTRTFVATFEA